MAIHNKSVYFTREQLVAHYSKRNSLLYFIYGIFRFFCIIIQNIYCVSSYLVLSWIVLLPISWVRSDLYSRLENYLYNWLLFVVSSWSLAAGATVIETGDDYRHLIEDPPRPVHRYANYRNGHEGRLSHRQSLNMKQDCMAGDTRQPSNVACDNKYKDKHEPDEKRTITTFDQSTKDLSTTDSVNVTHNCLKVAKDVSKNSTPSLESGGQELDSSFCHPVGDSAAAELPVAKIDRTKSRILFLCNHISTADVPLIMQSFSTLSKQSLLWVLDAQFKPTNFGLVCSSHGDFFITKDSFVDGSLRDQVLRHPDRNLLVLFPEGGFWRKRLEGSNRYALKNGLPMTKYVTHPRFGAFKDLIDPSVEVTHIVDATLIYDDLRDPLSILDIALGTRKEPAILKYKVYERSKINPTEEWLRNLWIEKDKLLEQYYRDRETTLKQFEGTMRSIKLDWLKVLVVHLFYSLVCYLTVYRLFSATSVTMLKARDLYYSDI